MALFLRFFIHSCFNFSFDLFMLSIILDFLYIYGNLQLICTVTPASSSMEETHNTLKFASRAKRVEIFASRNKV